MNSSSAQLHRNEVAIDCTDYGTSMHDEEAKVWSENGGREYAQTSGTGHTTRYEIDKDAAVGKEHNTEVLSLIMLDHLMHTSNFISRLWEAE